MNSREKAHPLRDTQKKSEQLFFIFVYRGAGVPFRGYLSSLGLERGSKDFHV